MSEYSTEQTFVGEIPLKPHACQVFAFLLSFVLMTLTCAFGFTGNSLSVVTLNRDRSLRTSVTKFLLTALAITDVANLVPVVFVIIIPAYCSCNSLMTSCSPALRDAIPYIEQYGWALASTTHMCAVYITVLVALHRFVYVCRPHDTERLSGLRRAKIQVTAVPLFAFVYNLPRVFEYQVAARGNSTITKMTSPEDVDDQDDQQCSRDHLEFTAVGDNLWFRFAYKNVSFLLFMFIIPLSVLLFVTFKLIATMRMRKNKNSQTSAIIMTSLPIAKATPLNRRQQSRDDNVTNVLIIIIVVFIVCQAPTLFQRFLLALIGKDAFICGHPYYYIERLTDYMVVFNSCVNFVVYVIFAPRFRRILVKEVLSFGSGRLAAGSVCCYKSRSRHRRSTTKSTTGMIGGGNCGATSGNDYCSEMAECFGVSSSQQVSSPHELSQHHSRQKNPASGFRMMNMLTMTGECPAERLPVAFPNPPNIGDDVSSSVSSAGSSSLLQVIDDSHLQQLADDNRK